MCIDYLMPKNCPVCKMCEMTCTLYALLVQILCRLLAFDSTSRTGHGRNKSYVIDTGLSSLLQLLANNFFNRVLFL